MFSDIRAAVAVLILSSIFSTASAQAGRSVTALEDSPQARALLAMQACTSAFKPKAQSAGKEENSGAIKLTFAKGAAGDLLVTLNYQMGMRAYANPKDPGLTFAETRGAGLVRDVRLTGDVLTFTTSNNAKYVLRVTSGGSTALSGTYNRPKDSGQGSVEFDLPNCTR